MPLTSTPPLSWRPFSLQSELSKFQKVNTEKQRYVECANEFLSDERTRELHKLFSERQTRLETIEEINAHSKELHKEIAKDRPTVATLRAQVNLRRQRLQDAAARLAKAQDQIPADTTRAVMLTKDRWRRVHQIYVHSKRVLVGELVSLFDLRHVEPAVSPVPQGGHRRRKGVLVQPGGGSGGSAAKSDGAVEEDEYEICGVRMRRAGKGGISKNDREELNAAIGHVVHLLSLLTQYLGVKLPYAIVNRGVYSFAREVLYKKRTDKQPLFLDEQNGKAFTIGLAMLNYDIAYLCQTQGVDVPLNCVANTLQNLLACCQSLNLGRYSHNATYALVPDQSFSLDFMQVVRITAQRHNHHLHQRSSSSEGLASVQEAALHSKCFYDDVRCRTSAGSDSDDPDQHHFGPSAYEIDDEGNETWDLVDVVHAPNGNVGGSAAAAAAAAVVNMVMGAREEARSGAGMMQEAGYSVVGAAGNAAGNVVGVAGNMVGVAGEVIGGVGSAVGSGLVALWAMGQGT
ncbi:UV radiation resistance protein and autophagy-related subunit 14-domain-containing protein [Jimgerdemannia flammicorona]|uniref:Autophagy-related protein 14 n=1 Tax=Jimgerdemannia flammicorona TaxID=994334 RepID=A0A433Q297_9FUNG|nr:UV radiation resistance protein and autophagy-related subunit 14-domain-containing protein [Jimgerdemannia flammicorona]